MTDYAGFRIDAKPCQLEQTDNGEGRWHSEVDQISTIVKNVLDSYERHGGINYAGITNLPSQQHIINISQTLQMLLFPGYYDTGAVEEAAPEDRCVRGRVGTDVPADDGAARDVHGPTGGVTEVERTDVVYGTGPEVVIVVGR